MTGSTPYRRRDLPHHVQAIAPQQSLWASGLPEVARGLPARLAELGSYFDDPRLFEPLRPYFHPTDGRPASPVTYNCGPRASPITQMLGELTSKGWPVGHLGDKKEGSRSGPLAGLQRLKANRQCRPPSDVYQMSPVLPDRAHQPSVALAKDSSAGPGESHPSSGSAWRAQLRPPSALYHSSALPFVVVDQPTMVFGDTSWTLSSNGAPRSACQVWPELEVSSGWASPPSDQPTQLRRPLVRTPDGAKAAVDNDTTTGTVPTLAQERPPSEVPQSTAGPTPPVLHGGAPPCHEGQAVAVPVEPQPAQVLYCGGR